MSSSSSSPAEAKRAEIDPTADESGGESVPQAVSQDAPLTETREFPPDASVSAPNLIASDQEPMAAASEALAGALGDARLDQTPPPPSEVDAEAVVEAAISDEPGFGLAAEAEYEDEEIDEELEADLEEEVEAIDMEAVPAGDAVTAAAEDAAEDADDDEDELVIDADAEIDVEEAAVAANAETDLGGESLRPELAAALADGPAFPDQITPAPETIDAPFATASADEEFLRRVVLPPPPVSVSAPLPAVGAPAPAVAELDDGESEERTVIS
jgi:hypothetical protein